MTKRNRYTPQQRELAVKMVLSQQKKCKERKDRYGIIPNVAKNLGIPVNTLKCWIKRAKKQTPPQKRGRPSLLSDSEMLVLKAFLNKCADHDFAVTKPVMVELIRKLTNNRIMVSTAKESRWLSRVLNRLNWNFKKQSYQYMQPNSQDANSSKSETGNSDSFPQGSNSTVSSPMSPSSFSVPSSTTASPISSPLMSVPTGSSQENTHKVENNDTISLNFSLPLLSETENNTAGSSASDFNTNNHNNSSNDDDIDAMAAISSNPQMTVDSDEIKARAEQLFWEITETKREFWKLGDIEASAIPQQLAMHQPLMQPQTSLLDTGNGGNNKQTLSGDPISDMGLGHHDQAHNPFCFPIKSENDTISQQLFNPLQMPVYNTTPNVLPFSHLQQMYYAQQYMFPPYVGNWSFPHHEEQPHLDSTSHCTDLSPSEHNHLGMNTTT